MGTEAVGSNGEVYDGDGQLHYGASPHDQRNPELISVFAVDRHPVLREGLREVFQQTERIHLLGEADAVVDAATRISILRPDVVIVDVQLRDGTGSELCTIIRNTYPDIRVLFLASTVDDESLFSSIEAGADGFLLKSASIFSIVGAVETVAGGGSVIDNSIAGMVLRRLRQPVQRDDGLKLLTPVEKDVLFHLVNGCSNREIAKHLYMSESTIKKYVTALMRKLGVRTRTEAAVFAMRADLREL